MRAALLVLALFVAPAFAGVKVTAGELVPSAPIYFDTGKATIRPQSYATLDEIAAAMQTHEKIQLVEIQNHTDARGNDAWNLEMSEKRAQAVYAYLVKKGVAAHRLRAKGYGESRPVDDRKDPRAWAKNRRTVFVILQTT